MLAVTPQKVIDAPISELRNAILISGLIAIVVIVLVLGISMKTIITNRIARL